MNYIHKIRYDKFISSRKLRKIPKNTYTENHHIKPKSLGGTAEFKNLIKLTARDHFIAHLILWKCYGGSMSIAFYMMTSYKRYKNKLTSKQYSSIKEDQSKIRSERMIGKQHYLYGKHISDEIRNKMSIAKKGKKSNFPNNSGQPLSEKHKKSIGEGNKGKRFSEEHKRKISKKIQGSIRSKETRMKMSEAAKRREKNKLK